MGTFVGLCVVGFAVGSTVVGYVTGALVGPDVGERVGLAVVGMCVGARVGVFAFLRVRVGGAQEGWQTYSRRDSNPQSPP